MLVKARAKRKNMCFVTLCRKSWQLGLRKSFFRVFYAFTPLRLYAVHMSGIAELKNKTSTERPEAALKTPFADIQPTGMFAKKTCSVPPSSLNLYTLP